MEKRFVNKRDAEELTGFSHETLKKWRLEGKLVLGIHWIKVGNSDRVIRYNGPLLIDFLQNQEDPVAHQRAIDAYLKSLPSNLSQKVGRKPKKSSVETARGGHASTAR